MSAAAAAGEPFEDQAVAAYLGLLGSIYERAENMASIRVRVCRRTGFTEAVCDRCGDSLGSFGAEGLTVLELDNRGAAHIGERHTVEDGPGLRVPLDVTLPPWERGPIAHVEDDAARATAVRPPDVEHCPICHGESAKSKAADGWVWDHDEHHGNHGCPRCDRDAGYPR